MEKQIYAFFLAAIYLLGVAVTYLLIKYAKTKKQRQWTKLDRSAGLLTAIATSWGGIVALVIAEMIFPKTKDVDESARW